MTLPAGSHLGRYQILELLGAGGMGMVYRANDERLQRDVAVKVLPPSVLTDEGARRRFRKEALALAKVSHPGIAAVYDVGEEGDTAYIVMECVPGESLAAHADGAAIPVADALRFSIQIADALAEAHEHGVVHRDLKPANVMITPRGQVKVLDFGIAKLLAPRDGGSATQSRTEVGAPAGTPLYMSPEQAFGESVDGRTDLWSLGVVLYELLAGRAPFSGATDWALLQAVSQQTPPSLRTLNAALPPDVEQIVARAMSKDVAARFQTATEMRDAMATSLARITAPAHVVGDASAPSTRRVAVIVMVTLVVVAAAGGWYLTNAAHKRWAREEALATVTRLTNNDMPLAAMTVLERARRYLPADTSLAHFATNNMRTLSVESSPSGVPVAIQDYLTPDSAWHVLGSTPIRSAAIPKGYFRWRLSPAGQSPVIVAPPVSSAMHFALDSMAAAAPGMVRVGAHGYSNNFAFIGWVGPYQFPAFDIDRNEVTNAEYQQFVDSGGYGNRKYWTEPFVDGGRTLSWDEAAERLRDATGRPGPAAWSGGHFPAGQDRYPVSGVSWYEAAAYLAFKGKTLPAMAQWNLAAQTNLASYIARESNMSHDHVQPVGSDHGVGPYGTNDMAGNVREWALNATATQQRLILGGAWGSPSYLYSFPEALPPFDRSLTNGIRGVRNLGTMPPAALGPIRMLRRDFAHYTPAPDAVFHAYTVMYDYDKTPLDATDDSVVAVTPDWKLIKTTYNTAYGNERMAAYLYLPIRVKPPYQAVVFFPSARIIGLTNSHQLGDVNFFDYIVQSGRAVIYPVYQNTYERAVNQEYPQASVSLAVTTQQSKDVERTLDYLQTRPDINHTDLAYLGVSWGAAQGAIFATLAQDRLRTAVLLDGGFLDTPHPGGDAADFVPRMKKPVLMVNGRYDMTFSLDESQNPFFAMLGTPAADKKHVLLEAAHDVTAEHGLLVREVLGWLDKYMGRVQ